MELDKAEALARELMGQHGLTAWSFKFDGAKRRFGLCSWRRQTISLSRRITLLNDETDVRDCILHEIAHALVDRDHGHDKTWQRKAREIGCDGKRCYEDHIVLAPKPWLLTCPNCGKTLLRLRYSNKQLACTACCKAYNADRWHPQYVMQWQRNDL